MDPCVDARTTPGPRLGILSGPGTGVQSRRILASEPQGMHLGHGLARLVPSQAGARLATARRRTLDRSSGRKGFWRNAAAPPESFTSLEATSCSV